jgi:hypothetical protein
MDTCARCNRPVDMNKGYFYDHNSGVKMHSLCFIGSVNTTAREPVRLPVPAQYSDRLAA